MIKWRSIETAPTTAPETLKDHYLLPSFPPFRKASSLSVTWPGSTVPPSPAPDGTFHPPTHWAEVNAPDEEGGTDWVVEAKSNEQSFMVTKDEYSDLARAIGIRGDSFFGDPIKPHREVVDRARSLMAAVSAAEAALRPFARFSATYPDAGPEHGIVIVEDARCPVVIGDMHAAAAALESILKLAQGDSGGART